jgi:phage tail-like protein
MDSNGLRFWMLSQLNDWLPPWRAVTAYIPGQGIVDANGNIQVAQNAGTTNAIPPIWGTTLSQTTVDAGISWINAGPGTWAATTAFSAGQYILDSNGNLQCAVKIASNGTTGATQPVWPVALGETVVDGNVTWSCAGPTQAGLFYCSQSNRLQLRSVRTGAPPAEDFTTATNMVAAVPMTLDQYGNYARWDASSGMVMAGGSGPGGTETVDEVPIYAPGRTDVTDLAMGYDGILYVAVGGSLVMIDRRGRWPNHTLTAAAFSFWRLTALPEGGVLALDRDKPQLGKVSGQPLQTGPADLPNPGILRPCDPNPDPPRIAARIALPASETFVALGPMDMTQQPPQYALLSWSTNTATNQIANLRFVNETTPATSGLQVGPAWQLGGVRLPYAVTGLGNRELAVLATNLNEGLIYDLSDAGERLVPAGETYILAANNVGPFVHGFDLPPTYANVAGALPLMLPLVPLSLNSLAASGTTNPAGPAIIDSGISQAVWHRIFVEAIVPPRCGALIWLTASDRLADLVDPTATWYPHILGDADTSPISAAMLPGTPRAVWQSIPTEVAFAPALLNEDPIQDRQGLFMALVQRANKVVRNLTGRYLGVRIQLNGDGLKTPEIAGLRAYGSRFSYVQKYLPAIYREAKFPPAADADGSSTRRDFLERFVNLFESQFTRIEDRIASAYLLTRSESTPDDSLPWLGSWIGIEPNSYPPDRRRARIQATPSLYKWRGTAKGVTQALDVATNGACSRGAIIVIEDFRLRHIFATILGADLSIKDDPLLPGYSPSSNSIVGDTLFLGDPRIQAELQALYATDLNIAGGARAAQAFYDSLAHRMTVFVHNHVEDVNLKLVERIVEAEKPAHVQAFARIATQPFMIGLASLLGVNTYLAPEPPRNPITVDVSDVGRYDVVTEMPTLDPRMDNGQVAAEFTPPTAIITGPAAVSAGGTITLNGAASAAPPGTTITSYRWTLVQPSS